MSASKQYSSLPLILGTAGTIVLFAGIGWFLLGDDGTNGNSSAVSTNGNTLSPQPIPSQTEPEPVARIDIASELRKAQLAADAEMLTAPAQQNALYYFGRVLIADPDNAVARRGLDDALARIALMVSDQLARGDLESAYALAAAVEPLESDHALVTMTRSALFQRADELVETARTQAIDGDDAAADAALNSVSQLPGIDEAYLLEARNTVAANRRSRLAGEAERIENERIAREEATAAWAVRVRGAIKSGQLLAPAGDSATDLINAYEAPEDAKTILRNEFLEALLAAGKESTANGNIADAEAYIEAASGLRADASGLEEMRQEIDRTMIANEQEKILSLSDFVRLNADPARYPRLAADRNEEGWVDVLFTVTASGETDAIEVIQAEPPTLFNDAAVEAVSKWTFEPRVYRGQALNQRASVRLVFQLQ